MSDLEAKRRAREARAKAKADADRTQAELQSEEGPRIERRNLRELRQLLEATPAPLPGRPERGYALLPMSLYY